MARKADVLSYLPPVLSGVYEMQGLAQGENGELNRLWQGLEDLTNDQFVESATENGVSRWESMLKIAPKATDTLTERKLNILVKLSGQHSYTLTVLDQQLETICGTGNYTVTVDYGAYTLSVRIALASASNYEAVKDLLERVIPVNMIIDLSLLYHQYGDYMDYTHTQLAPYTHQQLREEEITIGN